MRNQLKWYYETDEEVLLIGRFQGIDSGFPMFKDLYDIKTEKQIKDLHVKFNEMILHDKLMMNKNYFIRGYVTIYKKGNEKDFKLNEVIIERV